MRVIWWRNFKKHDDELDREGLQRLVRDWAEGECSIKSIDGVRFLDWMNKNLLEW